MDKGKNTVTITKSQVNFKKKLTVSQFVVVFSRFPRTASLYFLLYVHTQYTKYALVWFCSMYSLWLVVSEMILEIFWDITSSRIYFLKHMILHSWAEWFKTPYSCSGSFCTFIPLLLWPSLGSQKLVPSHHFLLLQFHNLAWRVPRPLNCKPAAMPVSFFTYFLKSPEKQRCARQWRVAILASYL